MYKPIILSLSVLMTFAACNQPEEAGEQKPNSSLQETQQSTSTTAIPLNAEQKWKVDAAMKPFITKSEELLKNYMEGDGALPVSTVAQELEDLNKQLIQSCTMTGEAHDALHLWLDPHMKLISSLKSENEKAKAQPLLEQLSQSFAEFHQYFQ